MEYKDFSEELDLDAVSFALEESSTSEPFNEPDTFWALIDMYICVMIIQSFACRCHYRCRGQ